MGKAITVFGFWILVCALLLMYQESIKGIAPEQTASYAVFNKSNLLKPYVFQGNSSDLVFSNDLGAITPERASTGTDTGTVAYPDWTQSLFVWAKVFVPIINFIGTPYFLFVWMGLGSTGAILGAVLSLLNLVIIVFVLTGRID